MPQDIPPMEAVNEDIADRWRKGEVFALADGYEVSSWSPAPIAAGVPATQVHVAIPVTGSAVTLTIILRLHSARALDELVGALLQHRQDVWGK